MHILLLRFASVGDLNLCFMNTKRGILGNRNLQSFRISQKSAKTFSVVHINKDQNIFVTEGYLKCLAKK